MKSSIFIFSLLMSFLFIACQTKSNIDKVERQLYFGGDILTMKGDTPRYEEALVTENGKIIFLGTKEEAVEIFGKDLTEIDIKGGTMLPGFIDGHSHYAAFSAQAIGAQILPPPDAGANNIETLIEILRAWTTEDNLKLTGWIFGMGFDDSVLEDQRFPTKEDLDKVSTDHPVFIIHISGHFASVNSKGLELLNITAKTPDPEGGLIRRIAGSQEPNGVLEELAAIPHMMEVITPKTKEGMNRFMEAGQEMALSYGYTTAQEGRAMQNHLALVNEAEKGNLKLDVVSYVDYTFMDEYLATDWYSKTYKNHYRIGGAKLTLDGSPQGRTAWRTQPYLIPPDGATNAYKGYPAIPNDEDVERIYETAFKNNWQILTHANGDAAIDQMIRTIRPSIAKYGNTDRRNVLIHGQYVREDQLDSLKKLDIIASLFPLHTFYWGDWHKEIIGDSLGNIISPTRTALKKGLKITIHTDAPVALPNLMRVVWTASSRTSRSGGVLGNMERLKPYRALKAITEWSAYQHFEEKQKGTLEEGKLADFVVLDKNPLKVPIEQIKDITVLKTIKEGVVIFNR